MEATSKPWVFQHIISGVVRLADINSVPKCVSEMIIPEDKRLELVLHHGNRVFGARIYPQIFFYELRLPADVDYDVTVSATIDQGFGHHQCATVANTLSNGRTVPLQSGVPLLVVGLTNPDIRDAPGNFKLILSVQFPVPIDSNMHNHVALLGSLRISQLFADCTIFTNDGRSFRAHKAILGVKCEVIKLAFEKQLAEGKSGEFKIDCDYQTAQRIMAYCYNGEVPPISVETIMNLYPITHMYGVEGLQTYLADKLVRKATQLVDITNVLQFTIFAERFSLEVFYTFCLDFIGAHKSDVERQAVWEEFCLANPRVIQQLFTL